MVAELRQRHKLTRNGIHQPSASQQEMLRNERNSLVLWRKPLVTLYYFVLELLCLLKELVIKLWNAKRTVFLCCLLVATLTAVYYIDGAHQETVESVEKTLLWWGYWVGLGILSSVGLGTGLHTFLLYLGPHIASVTLAAFICKSVDFPEPPYPSEIKCPSSDVEEQAITVWTIMSKVRLEAFMWGAGTALGELPPYFMARAARLSGQMDEEEEEIEELLEESRYKKLSFIEKVKVSVHNIVLRAGFFGILLCASIPNPLFDLAGITCGHFLVPFWTFFGATLIGKAIIKMHIQKLFVIFTFSEHHVELAVNIIGNIPWLGPMLQSPFKDWFKSQKENLRVTPGEHVEVHQSVLSHVFEVLVLAMVVFFVVSIVNSMAQKYHKRLSDERSSKPCID